MSVNLNNVMTVKELARHLEISTSAVTMKIRTKKIENKYIRKTDGGEGPYLIDIECLKNLT